MTHRITLSPVVTCVENVTLIYGLLCRMSFMQNFLVSAF